MRKLILIVHASLDGFVAGEYGEFDNFKPSPENLDFVCSLTDDADAALVGRVSYQMLESYWSTAGDKENATKSDIKYSNWYKAADKIVLSKTLSNHTVKTKVISDNIAVSIQGIKAQSGKNILMFGSPTTFETLSHLNLIDEYWVIQYPVFFGKGIPFFNRIQNSSRLKLLSVKQFSEGEIAIHYSL
ncbi:dihydrofolate reductase family protein [Mariniflexile litorale]|uniref:Dihydrofolate reductase family protein n=1 Tax=Mariniflexile litorale TaxID=3045158 RepID=A0AAU7EDA0_9FLAO|nr:dihydrofolate reductase family protein [Mariniflexile sp. KMM 9835]MDQ8213021.1 dihydrofolate reductase family protein [Mariniflexile sp. KMM 9835]